MVFKCLSIQQPYAAAFAFGPKTFENRTWVLNHRGVMLVHAGKSTERLSMLDEVRDLWPEATDEDFQDFGMVIGAVEIIDCPSIDLLVARARLRRVPQLVGANGPQLETARSVVSPWAEGPYCIERSERRLRFSRPFPLRGMQGLFSVDVPASHQAELRAFAKEVQCR